MWTNSVRPILVLGLGNPIMGDDGVGIVALEQFRDRFEVSDGVELMDGGTWGMNLLPYIESAGKLLLVDAIRSGLEPGADAYVDGPDLPRILGQKLSAHQVDIVDVLTLCQLRGTLPHDGGAWGRAVPDRDARRHDARGRRRDRAPPGADGETAAGVGRARVATDPRACMK